MGYLIRTVIAAVLFLLFLWIVPAVFGLLDIPANPHLMTIIKACGAGISFIYIVRGPSGSVS